MAIFRLEQIPDYGGELKRWGSGIHEILLLFWLIPRLVSHLNHNLLNPGPARLDEVPMLLIDTIFVFWIYWWLFFRKQGENRQPTSLPDMLRDAFGRGTRGDTLKEAWNREAATYLRFVYSDRLYGPVVWVRLGLACFWAVCGYVLIGCALVAIYRGSLNPPTDNLWLSLLLVAFVGDVSVAWWLASKKKQEFGSRWNRDCAERWLRQTYSPDQARAEMDAVFPNKIHKLPWWWMDGTGDRVLPGLQTIYGTGFLVSVVMTISILSRHVFSMHSIWAWGFIVIAAPLLWIEPALALLRAASWCGYGDQRPSFPLLVLYADLRDLR